MSASARMVQSAEAVANVLSPNIVLPAQIANRGAATGERRLMCAVLEEAVVTFQRHFADPTRRGQSKFGEVREWFDSEDTSWAFAFESICHVLRIDPDYLRHGLATWMETRRGSARDARRSRFRRASGRRTPVSCPTPRRR